MSGRLSKDSAASPNYEQPPSYEAPVAETGAALQRTNSYEHATQFSRRISFQEATGTGPFPAVYEEHTPLAGDNHGGDAGAQYEVPVDPTAVRHDTADSADLQAALALQKALKKQRKSSAANGADSALPHGIDSPNRRRKSSV